jgi:hypothetical protein
MRQINRDRWFARGVESGIDPDEFTAVERETHATIRRFMETHRGRNDELMHNLDLDGTRRLAEATGESEALLTEEAKAALAAAGGGRLWHNHPSGQSLSGGDWFAAGAENVEVMVVTLRGSIFAGRIAEWRDEMYPIIKAYQSIYDMTAARLLGAGNGRLRPQTGVAGAIGHLMALELARRRLVTYSFLLGAEDQAALEDPSALPFVRAAEAEIAQGVEAALRRVPHQTE